jgi:hypothetical protein
MRNYLKTLSVSLACALAAPTFAQSGPEVTPYRPGAAAGSSISAAGYFELELNIDTAKAAGSRLDLFGAVLKYGLNDRSTLLFGLPYARFDGAKGLNDASLGFKFVNKLSDTQGLGFQIATSLPTGEKQFRSDDPTVGLLGIYGIDFSGFHADFNLGARFNTADVSASRTFLWVAGLSRPIGNGLGWYVEASGANPRFAPDSTTVLGALTYTANRKLAFDINVSSARSGGVTATGVGVGMTYLFAR